jgi:uncharacterized protein (DUF697 family)
MSAKKKSLLSRLPLSLGRVNKISDKVLKGMGAARLRVLVDASAATALLEYAYEQLFPLGEDVSCEVVVFSAERPRLDIKAELNLLIAGDSAYNSLLIRQANEFEVPLVTVAANFSTLVAALKMHAQRDGEVASSTLDMDDKGRDARAQSGGSGDSGRGDSGAESGSGGDAGDDGSDDDSSDGDAGNKNPDDEDRGAGDSGGKAPGGRGPGGVASSEAEALVRNIIAVPAGAQLNAETLAALFAELGRWVGRNLPKERLTFGRAYPFMRAPIALEVIYDTAFANSIIAAAFFIPGADLPVLTANQVRMVIQLASLYGLELGTARFKELGVVVGGAFGVRAIARRLIARLVPVAWLAPVGWFARGALGYFATLGIGLAALAYYEKSVQGSDG